MPYGEQTIKDLQQSADITPMGIQLEVNAEIYRVIYNIIWNTQEHDHIDFSDLQRLEKLWFDAVQEIARIETRKGYYIPMEQQIESLQEAYSIERKYIPDQIFRALIPNKLTPELLTEESAMSPADAEVLFNDKVWPSISHNKTMGNKNPMAFIVAGQPGAGKTRMSSLLLMDWHGDMVQAAGDNFRGFHPHYAELMKQYGQYCPFFTQTEGQMFTNLVVEKAAEERCNILYESSLGHIDAMLQRIALLKDKGYTIWILLRASSKKESWKSIHQLYLQQRLKAPGLSRLITRKQHDKACQIFLSSAGKLVEQNLMDRLIVKSARGLLYDSDDMPTESVSDLLARRMEGD
jgi:UDP-N-acetylglucosamine kinase